MSGDPLFLEGGACVVGGSIRARGMCSAAWLVAGVVLVLSGVVGGRIAWVSMAPATKNLELLNEMAPATKDLELLNEMEVLKLLVDSSGMGMVCPPSSRLFAELRAGGIVSSSVSTAADKFPSDFTCVFRAGGGDEEKYVHGNCGDHWEVLPESDDKEIKGKFDNLVFQAGVFIYEGRNIMESNGTVCQWADVATVASIPLEDEMIAVLVKPGGAVKVSMMLEGELGRIFAGIAVGLATGMGSDSCTEDGLPGGSADMMSNFRMEGIKLQTKGYVATLGDPDVKASYLLRTDSTRKLNFDYFLSDGSDSAAGDEDETGEDMVLLILDLADGGVKVFAAAAVQKTA